VADPHLEGQHERCEPDLRSVQARLETSLRNDLGRLREALADSGRSGREGQGAHRTAGSSAPDCAREAADKSGDGCIGRIWEVEPDVGRVADGVPSRVDRLRALGNAVVPQIPEIIGRAILQWHAAQLLSASKKL
jgi:DNA (cytosine-5)-methyltransferase 1